ncbi:MAG: DNA-deoxyinosine glycosylase [Clostridiales bacterium]|nr:DNA-deoxyinosine glycosylase [Clostridiales bacterium]
MVRITARTESYADLSEGIGYEHQDLLDSREEQPVKKTGALTHVIHPFPPLFDCDSRILILGSFPSVKSREQEFFYGHPQNRFWKVMARIHGEEVPVTVEEKKKMLLKHHIALWDVISSCDIKGSSDSSITNVTANDLSTVLSGAKIERITVNGKTAEKYYIKYIEQKIRIKAGCLPSTSPANAAWNIERLAEAWEQGLYGERKL